MTILVTGAAGFIGSCFVRHHFEQALPGQAEPVVSLDALTYAGHPSTLEALPQCAAHTFVQGNICDAALVQGLLQQHTPRAIVHFAAETHVDRSIHGAAVFMQTNITGTYTLLECARAYWAGLPSAQASAFRFLHVSTDEVYGSLGETDAPFTEAHPYQPNSPYSASKAASDHLVRAWHHTYGLPVLTTHCSNNYGPYHFPEKLIPLLLLNALEGKPMPVYGDGLNVRDWLYVQDHARALALVLKTGTPGQTYNIGASSERTNLQVVHALCDLLDELKPRSQGGSYREQIQLVADRPGHDRRYAIDADKLRSQLGWSPLHGFEEGLRKTVQWNLQHLDWLKMMRARVV